MNKKKCTSFLMKGILNITIVLLSISNFLINKNYLELDGNEFLWFGHILSFMIFFPAGMAFIIRYSNCMEIKKL